MPPTCAYTFLNFSGQTFSLGVTLVFIFVTVPTIFYLGRLFFIRRDFF